MSKIGEERPMPRLLVIRHGETEWSINGRHTGTTDIPLTENGEEIIRSKSAEIVGPGKLVDPADLCHVYISPRQRAQKTYELLFKDLPEKPIHTTTAAVREWDYGEYEGLLPREIKAKNPGWSIWSDGCPGGESVKEMVARVDAVIAFVREHHRQYVEEGIGKRDILIFSHGHFSRVLISRWMEFDLCLGTHFNMVPGGVALLCYNHNSLKEPSLTGLNLYAF